MDLGVLESERKDLLPFLKGKLCREVSSSLSRLDQSLSGLKRCTEEMRYRLSLAGKTIANLLLAVQYVALLIDPFFGNRNAAAPLEQFSGLQRDEKATPTASMSWHQAGVNT